jgi:homogentisate 1,2-dioxygenase
MPFYQSRGEIPAKRHTQFRQPDGSLYKEELVSSYGFHGIYSNLYHIYNPTEVHRVDEPYAVPVERALPYKLEQTHLRTSELGITGTDYLQARVPLLVNDDVQIEMLRTEALSMPYFYKNGEADEVLFFHEGTGRLYTPYGTLEIRQGDYVVIPRTVIYKLELDGGTGRILVIESRSPIETPNRYRNAVGQLLEHSPFCERDFRAPEHLMVDTERGAHTVKIKKAGMMHTYHYHHSPLDVVGWDGYLFPYAFSIYDFEPITGRIHQPPPVHQTFQAHNFVICSFVPRLFDYHPLSIPAPYNHSNIDSDEVLYYAEGNFMSRRGIDRGSFTLHPGGLPHGPHPGTVEKSIGAKETEEYAVMIDTFRPLYLTKQALAYKDEQYPYSWLG